MDREGANAFVYAKACGDLGKSFVGERSNRLFEAKSLTELWTLLFPQEPVPMVPEVVFAKQIEKKSFDVFINKFISFIDCYDNLDSFLKDQLSVYEVENLKTVVDSLCAGETKLPELNDLKKHKTLHLEEWPNLEKITSGTSYAWLKQIPDIHHQQEIEYKLDIQTIQHIWNSTMVLSGDDGEALRSFLLDEWTIQNIIWALRLKINFGFTKEQILKHLMFVTDKVSLKDPICSQAIKVLDKDPLNFGDWENWKYKDLLNPKTDALWKLDPSWIEKKYRSEQNKKASVLFHSFPVSSGALFGWFKLKQYELGLIRMAVESLRLNVHVRNNEDEHLN